MKITGSTTKLFLFAATVLAAFSPLTPRSSAPVSTVELGRVPPKSKNVKQLNTVDKLNQYLRKALSGQWRYDCTEYVQKDENQFEFIVTKNAFGEVISVWNLGERRKKSAVFEYSLRLKGRKISEKRTARLGYGEKVMIGKDEGEIFPYKARGIILNPMQYLGRLTGNEIEYRYEGRENFGDFEAVVLGFKTAAGPEEPHHILSGKLWIHPEDGAILRLSLDRECWSYFETVEIPKEYTKGKEYGQPLLRRSLSLTADFKKGDRGIHFPSRMTIIEEYGDGRDVKMTANTWTIRFGDFRFESTQLGNAVEAADPILKKAAEYCDRLKTIALQYICDERIVRTTYTYDVVTIGKNPRGIPARKRWNLNKKSTREVLYDYQLLRKGDRLEEKRTALKFDGKKWTQKEDPPGLLPYQARYIIFGPIGFLGSSWQTGFDYFLEGREKASRGRELAVLVSQPNEIRNENAVYGRLWVESDTGAVRRVSWDPESIEFFHADEAPPIFQGLEKRLVWTASYDIEKNGIYFPSQQEIREEYLKPSGETIPGEVWTVTYENYRFFTVGVEIDIKKVPSRVSSFPFFLPSPGNTRSAPGL